MCKKLLITLVVFVAVGACIYGAGMVAAPETGVYSIESASACPATKCASGKCHGFDNIPEVDGVHEMTCPESTCSSVECHAWDALVNRYHQASDASLNLWVLAPVVVVVGLVVLVRLLSRGSKGDLDSEHDLRFGEEGDSHLDGEGATYGR